MRVNPLLEFYARLFDMRAKLGYINGYAQIDPIYLSRLCVPISSSRKG